MQEVVKNFVKEKSAEGMDQDQIAIYLKGAFDGINSFSINLKENKLEIESKENDPLFIHTWNHVIDLLAEQMEEIAKQALAGIPGKLGVNYDDNIGRETKTNPVDQRLSTENSTKK